MNAPRFPRISLRTEAINAIVRFCTMSGTVFGVLALVASGRLYFMLGVGGGLVVAALLGTVVGFVSSIVAVPLLVNRDVVKAKPMIAWSTGIIMLAWINLTLGAGLLPILFAPVVFLSSLVITRGILPRIYLDAGVCRNCGYDLRASLEIGRCPECGRGISDQTSTFVYHKIAANGLVLEFARGTWLFALRHPLLPLMLIILGWILPIELASFRRSFRKWAVERAIDQVVVAGVIDLDTLTTFEWDTVFVYGPYAKLTRPATVDRWSWAKMEDRLTYQTFVDDGHLLFVFVSQNNVAEFFDLLKRINVPQNTAARAISRAKARFQLVGAPGLPRTITQVD